MEREDKKGVEAQECRGDDKDVVSGGWLRQTMWRGSIAVGFVFEMFEDLSNDARLGNENDDAESSATRTP